MTPPTGQELHQALLRALQPVTRWRHPFPGDGPPVRVNEHGVDVWENHVGDVRLDADGTCHAYVFLQSGPGGRDATRTVAAATVTRWSPILTFVGGTPRKAQWGIDQVAPILDGLVLTGPTGELLTAPLRQGGPFTAYDPGPLRPDNDPSPPRWFVPIQYATTAH